MDHVDGRINGSITPSGTRSVNPGGDATYTISPDTCYRVADVVVDGVSWGAVTTYTFTNVQANHTIDASFVLSNAIIATADAGGSITPRGTIPVPCGGDQTFVIAADPGSDIIDVLVDGHSMGPLSSYTFTNVREGHTIHASFSLPPSIMATASAGGSITPSGNVSVPTGSDQTFAITADPDFAIVHVLVDEHSMGPLSSYTFSNVHESHTIHAKFARQAEPSARLIYPNGGENLFVGDESKIAWTAGDIVSSVDLLICRSGSRSVGADRLGSAEQRNLQPGRWSPGPAPTPT